MKKSKNILHIGNIAQNAYINSLIFRENGWQSDVLAPDFYHFASSPEWYELGNVEVDPEIVKAPYYPDLYRLKQDMPLIDKGVAQGPLYSALVYLWMRRTGHPLAGMAGDTLAYKRFKATKLNTAVPELVGWTVADLERHLADGAPVALEEQIRRGFRSEFQGAWIRARLDGLAPSLAEERNRRRAETELEQFGFAFPVPIGFLDDACALDPELAAVLAALRADGRNLAMGLEYEPPVQTYGPHLAAYDHEEVRYLLTYERLWRQLFAQYDEIITYGPSVMWPFLVGDVRYSALEHGTIRSMPFNGTREGRLVRDGFLAAENVFITNTDYLIAERRLTFEPGRMHYLPHPFDERRAAAFIAGHTPSRPDETTFLVPARQDWVSGDPQMAKGVDRVFHAAARLKADGSPPFRLRCVRWGVDVAASDELIASLGIADEIEWLAPMSRSGLWAMMLDSHCVIDQFLLPAIGAISIESMALGCRLLTRGDSAVYTDFFGEDMPVLSATSIDEIAGRMREVIADPLDLQERGARGRRWIEQRHSTRVLMERQLHAFETAAARRNLTGEI